MMGAGVSRRRGCANLDARTNGRARPYKERMRSALLAASAIFLFTACHAVGPDETTSSSSAASATPSFTATTDDEIAGEILIDAKDDVSAADVADLARIAGVPL